MILILLIALARVKKQVNRNSVEDHYKALLIYLNALEIRKWYSSLIWKDRWSFQGLEQPKMAQLKMDSQYT